MSTSPLPPLMARAAADLRAAPWMPPFQLRLAPLDDALGTCSRGPGGRFTLTLDRGLTLARPAAMVPTLTHEAAHALTWSIRGQSDHGPAFGRAYARVWRLLHPAT